MADSPPAIRFFLGDVQEFGRGGNPQSLYHVRGTVASPENVTTAQFRIGKRPVRIVSITRSSDRGSHIGGSRFGGSPLGGSQVGDFRIAIRRSELHLGINRLTVQCLHRDGTTTRKELVLVRHRAEKRIESATQTARIDWPTVSRISDVGEIVTGKWTKNRLGFRSLGGSLAIGDQSWGGPDRDIEIALMFQQNKVVGPTPQFTIRTGWEGIDADGSDGGSQSTFRWTPHRNQTSPHQSNEQQTLRIRHRVQRTAPTGFRVRSKHWGHADGEPDQWQDDRIERFLTGQPGSLLISVTDMDITLLSTTIRFPPSD